MPARLLESSTRLHEPVSSAGLAALGPARSVFCFPSREGSSRVLLLSLLSSLLQSVNLCILPIFLVLFGI